MSDADEEIIDDNNDDDASDADEENDKMTMMRAEIPAITCHRIRAVWD